MNVLRKKIIKIMSRAIFLFTLIICGTFAEDYNENGDDYLDKLIGLIYGNSIEIVPSEEIPNYDEQASLEGGVWKCGNCDNIDSSYLLYSEVNEIDTNVTGELPIELQVGISEQGMSCVTVSAANSEAVARRVAGACAGPSVTLAVTAHAAGSVVVNVYGDRK